MTVKMIASRRYYRLDERKEYKPGEIFYARDDGEADKLERTHKAVRATKAAPKPNPTDLPPKPPADDGTAALRAEYEALVGKRPFMGWGAEDLKDRMETYRRRDLTVSDYSTTALKAED